MEALPHEKPRIARPLRWGLGFAWFAWVTCFVTECLIVFVDVEAVGITGLLIALPGIAAVIIGVSQRYALLAIAGAAYGGVFSLFVGLVNTLHWSPTQAKEPFAIMGAVFVAATLPLMFAVTRRVPRRRSPFTCVQCGYTLFGLKQPRCPECNTGFDPSILGRLPDHKE